MSESRPQWERLQEKIVESDTLINRAIGDAVCALLGERETLSLDNLVSRLDSRSRSRATPAERALASAALAKLRRLHAH